MVFQRLGEHVPFIVTGSAGATLLSIAYQNAYAVRGRLVEQGQHWKTLDASTPEALKEDQLTGLGSTLRSIETIDGVLTLSMIGLIIVLASVFGSASLVGEQRAERRYREFAERQHALASARAQVVPPL